MDVTVILPALNEEATVGDVVHDLQKAGSYEVIVVDNGSSDRTGEVAAAAGARVVREPRQGYGAACLAGVQAATRGVLCFMDADGSFRGQEIPRLVTPILDGQAELVLGSRVLAEKTADAVLPHQRLGNSLATWLLRVCCGMQVTDLGPFRAVRASSLRRLQMSEMTYGWPIEMMVKAHRLGLRILEVPVTCHPRAGGDSKVSGTLRGSVLAGLHILKVILRHFGWRSGEGVRRGIQSDAG
jgi:glycosyltransferase involved in cell wall biosynthesis